MNNNSKRVITDLNLDIKEKYKMILYPNSQFI